MKESKIQSDCFVWYNNMYCLKLHEPRGIMYSNANELAGNNAIATMRAKATGLRAGVADTTVILPNGRLIYVEFKNEKGRQSEKQKEFEKIVSDLGFKYYIVRSLEEFKEVINNNLKTEK